MCANGGNCTSPGVCNCTSDWDGPSCETGDGIIHMSATTYLITIYTAICDPMCANGGNCTSPGVCNCTSDWDGPSCETGDGIIHMFTTT